MSLTIDASAILAVVANEPERPALIAAASNIYAYDAYLIACAQSRRLPLLTLDRGLARAAAQAGVSLVEVKA